VADDNSTRDSIRKRMARLRCELENEVEAVVERTKELTDWRGLVRKHPWISLGIAAAAGYMIVPRRAPAIRPRLENLEELANSGRLVVQPQAQARMASGILANAINLAVSAIVRAGIGAAGRQIGALMASHQDIRPPSTQPQRWSQPRF
jgi:hypothetical protein